MRNNSGFTIMELLTAIAIVGILSAVAVPNMITWRNNMQFNSAVRSVKISIEGTRMNALRTNMPSRLEFNVGGDTFDSVRWDQAAGAETTVTHQLPPGTTLSGSTLLGNRLRFDSRGMSNNGRVTIQSGGGLCRQIVVAITGSSRIQNCP